ncbi:unnamed protein product [Rotaria sp. Silwood1]|nr:unnamed protein product [Rotaria sp. Silwood1]
MKIVFEHQGRKTTIIGNDYVSIVEKIRSLFSNQNHCRIQFYDPELSDYFDFTLYEQVIDFSDECSIEELIDESFKNQTLNSLRDPFEEQTVTTPSPNTPIRPKIISKNDRQASISFVTPSTSRTQSISSVSSTQSAVSIINPSSISTTSVIVKPILTTYAPSNRIYHNGRMHITSLPSQSIAAVHKVIVPRGCEKKKVHHAIYAITESNTRDELQYKSRDLLDGLMKKYIGLTHKKRESDMQYCRSIIARVPFRNWARKMSSDTGILRTPDSVFINLLDYPFKPNYIDLSNPGCIGNGKTKLRLHYLDEGNKNSKETVLLLHGEPTWSYLYRHFIPSLKQYRVIAFDFIGFGKSDKPINKTDYTYQRHVNWTKEAIEYLNLNNITLFCQDWGTLIGLQLVGTNGIGNRFARVIAANGWLPTGDGPITDGFLRWQKFALKQTKMDVGWIIKRSVIREMKPKEIAAYNAPFPNEKYQAGALIFPQLVPTTPDNPSSPYNRDAWKNLQLFHRPFLTLFSDSDPVTAGAEKLLQMSIPGANGQAHAMITQAGHFLQEEKPHEIVEHLIKFINDNPLPLDSKP